jgi:hypothetical protein
MTRIDEQVERLARTMVAAAGHCPADKIVYSWPPYEILTPSGRVYEAMSTGVPLWHCYVGLARLALEHIETEKRSTP